MPGDWKVHKLRELIAIRHGYAFASEYYANDGPYVLLTPGNFREEGGFRWLGNKQKFYRGPVPTAFVLKAGDMLVAMTEQTPGLLGSTFFVPTGAVYLHNQRLGAIDLIAPSELELEYLHYLMASTPLRREISADAGGTKVRHTSPEKLLSIEVQLPPLIMQRRIAEILRAWDQAIDKTERLIRLNQDRLRGVQQRLFGEIALTNHNWKSKSLGTIADRVRRKSDGADHPIMTISGKSGFIRQDEKFSRFMAGDSLENYTLLKRGEFAYNKGNSKTFPQGCIYRLEQETALVPHVYISFELHSGLNTDFYAHLFHTGFLNRQLARLINSGIRNDGLLNLSIEDFFGCEVPVPSPDQQARIADFFGTTKRELVIIEAELEHLQRQKLGLMQKLLTGTWRLPVRSRDIEVMETRAAKEVSL